MDEGYFGELSYNGNTTEYMVYNQNGDYLGNIVWDEDWGCYTFRPRALKRFGPAFLAWITAEMVRLEAKKRKGGQPRSPSSQGGEREED